MIDWDKLPPHLTEKQVVACGVARQHIPHLLANGRLTFERFWEGDWRRFHKASVRRFVEGNAGTQNTQQNGAVK